MIFFGLVSILSMALVFVGYRARQGAGRGGIVGLVLRPQTAQLATADDLDLAAGSIRRWEWVASARQPTCRLTGQIDVLEGGDRDVQVFVLSAADYDSLANGGEAYALLQTERQSVVKLDVTSSEPGRMILAISNRFSPHAAKVVRLRRVRVVCQ